MSAAGDANNSHSGRFDRQSERDKIEKLSGADRPTGRKRTEHRLDLREKRVFSDSDSLGKRRFDKRNTKNKIEKLPCGRG